MRGFMTVLKFEIMHYFKNKAYMITTAILVALCVIGLSIPTVIDLVKGDDGDTDNSSTDVTMIYGLYQAPEVSLDTTFLQSMFTIGEIKIYDDVDLLKKDVEASEIESGFLVSDPLTYTHVVINNEMSDSSRYVFETSLKEVYRKSEAEKSGYVYETLKPLFDPAFHYELEVLGKDSMSNYLYTYILVFGLYFLIIMYGQLIATSVASEKSNRTMELLVTSTKSTYLIFGKVLGGAFAGIFQFGVIIAVAKLMYNVNAEAWAGKLDFVMNIPVEIILKFSVFGILGYVFYAFIFGALGALVSRTEDVGASVMPVTLIFVAVFMVSVIGMQNTEGMLLKVASFIPFSSFMAMFVRISMGTVSAGAVAISLSLLVASTLFIGWLGSKIYRMGTLMYGNPVKLKDIYKILKSQ